MQNVKNTMIDKMLAVVAPHLCLGCGKEGTLLCDSCKDNISRDVFRGCLLCESSTSAGVCQKHQVAYQQAWVASERKATLQRLIDGFKFQNKKAAAKELAELLDARLPSLPPETVVVPVPTVSSHVRVRGYDHASLLAQHFAQRRRLPFDNRLLGRLNKDTQHFANRAERIQQASSAFEVVGQVDPKAHYLIIDDIVTTGSTLQQAALLLTEAGATRVSVGVVARQPLD